MALSTFWAGLALVSGIEPFSTGVFIGAGLVSSGLYAGWDRVKCQLKECCHRGGHWIPHNVTYLEGLSKLNHDIYQRF